jgi:hypothetical protein
LVSAGNSAVMPGLDPGIHQLRKGLELRKSLAKEMD